MPTHILVGTNIIHLVGDENNGVIRVLWQI